MRIPIRLLPAGLLIAVLFGGFYHFSTFSGLEDTFADRLTRELRPVDPRIVIVGIDEPTLERFDKNIQAWSRNVYASVIGRILQGGAKAVWLDVLLSGKNDPADNQALAALIRDHPNVYVGAEIVDGTLRPLDVPIPFRQMGHVHFAVENEVVRKGILSINAGGAGAIPSADVILANALLPERSQIHRDASGRWFRGSQPIPANAFNEVYFSYAQPMKGGFRYISFNDIYEGRVSPDQFHGAAVLIGAYAESMGDDAHYTPMSRSVKVYGVHIHANFLQSLLDGKLYAPLPKGQGWALILLVSLVCSLWFEYVHAKRAAIVLAALLCAYIIAAIAVFIGWNVLLPLIYPAAVMPAVYVLSVVGKYVREEKERRRVTSLFSRYVSQPVVEQLLAAKSPLDLGGIRRDITIMFVDIRGFTPLCEKLTPEQIVEVLNSYLDLCTDCVFRYNGTLDKYIGDGILALFGAPVAADNHTEMAVRAALDMKAGSEGLLRTLEARFGHRVHFGIGIHSGEAIIGNIGSRHRLDYTAIGDNVNIAARLESYAKPNQILISEPVADRLKDSGFRVVPIGNIKLKGKRDEMMVYEVAAAEGEKASSNTD